jgi:predicted short-subunit dehydrogenase-like oxidoreductase (DUF2520 family)
MIRLGLIGPGKVGRSLVQALPRERYALGPVMGAGPSSSRSLVRDLRAGRAVESAEAFKDCDVVLIATPEAAMEDVVDRLTSGSIAWADKTVLHTCRLCSAPLRKLSERGASVGGLFPIQAFPQALDRLQGVHFVLAGDGAAVRVGRSMVQTLKGHSHVVSPQGKLQASVASSIATEVLSGVVEMSVRRLMAAGLSRRRSLESLRPMIAVVLEDRRRGGGRPSPFSDGDAAVLDNLAKACDQSDPADGALYRKALRLALEALEVDDADLRLAAAARGPCAEPA